MDKDFIELMMQMAGVNLSSSDCERIYPDITMDKSLDLIRLIVSSDRLEDFEHYSDLVYDIPVFIAYILVNKIEQIDVDKEEYKNFLNSLSRYATILMDRGILDKEKVKEVLER